MSTKDGDIREACEAMAEALAWFGEGATEYPKMSRRGVVDCLKQAHKHLSRWGKGGSE